MARLRSNDPCWCGSGRKLKRCHGDHAGTRRTPVVAWPGFTGRRPVDGAIGEPAYVASGRPAPGGLQRLDAGGIARMRVAGRIAAEVLLEVAPLVRPGVTTDELDAAAHEAYVARGAYPSTLGYRGYPKSVCTSVNEVVCHGIPDGRPLAAGDIVNVDVTAFVDGVHGDTSATFAVGDLDEPTRALVETTRAATYAGIDAVRPGVPVRVIGEAIQALAHARGLGIIQGYGGHGIGAVFHAPPHVPHHIDPGATTVLEPGLCFTIEPMLTAGTHTYHQWADGWTVVTDDLLPSAQFEHTVVVTEAGADILTLTAAGRTAV